MKKKTVALLLALALVFGGAVGGTIAWLTDVTSEVKNTFTVGDINIELKETKTNFKMVPGSDIEKDPKVTVKANSEACWLFVEITDSANLSTYITYTVADGWTKGTGTGEGGNGVPANVYYREVNASDKDQSFSVLKDDKVSVKDTVTKQEMEAAETNAPTLTFKAYAIQKDNVTSAADAWTKVKT